MSLLGYYGEVISDKFRGHEMNPQEPLQTPVPEPNQTPPEKKKMSKKTLIRIIVVGVLVAIIALTAAVFGFKALLENSAPKKTSDTLDDSIYHMRDGYDIKEYGSTVGDPLALSMEKLDKTFKSSVGPVVYACNVISLNDLTTQKTYVQARSDAKAVIRTFIDGGGQAGVQTNQYTLPSGGDDDNNCNYSLESGGILSVSVYQPPFTAKEAITDSLGRLYAKTDSVNGLDTYKYKRDDDSRSTYMVVSGNDAIEVTFNGTKLSQDANKKLLALAAKNFADLQTTPKGPAIPAYDTPTYKKASARACDLISNGDIKVLTGSDASVYATEGLASGTGVSKVNDTLYNSISTSCSRFNTGLGSGLTAGAFDQKLEVTVTSFNEDAAAKFVMEETGKGVAEKTPASIGDEAFGYRDSAGQNTVFLRQGRFVVEVMFDRTVQRNANLQDTAMMTQKLTPYSQQVATKLKTME